MTLTYIRENSFPVYTALSSDIDIDGKIDGASLIGKTVYTYDDKKWYIIKEDLTLDYYFIPSSKNSQLISTDEGNSSTTNLAASGSFVGESISTLDVAGIQVSLKTDQNCLIKVRQSQDNIHWDIIDTYNYDKLVNNFGVTVQAVSSYVSVVVENLSTISATTYFRLQTILCPTVEALPRSLSEYGYLKTTTIGLKDDFGFQGEFSPSKDLRVAQPYKLVGTTLGNSLDASFITPSTSGTGAVASVSNSTATISSGTSLNGYGQLQSVLKARYVFGMPNVWKGIVRIPSLAINGCTRRFGMFSTSGSVTPYNGAFFELDDSTISLHTVSNGVEVLSATSGSFNGLVSEYKIDTNAHSYEIVAFTNGVWFFIDEVLIHKTKPTDKILYASLTVPITVSSYNSSGSSSGTVEIFNTSISRIGREITAPTSRYIYGTTSASGTVLKIGSGALHNVIISNVSNNSNVTLYDSSSGSSTNGVIFSTGAMSNNLVPFSIPLSGLPFFNGLSITVTGASCNTTMVFE